MDLFRLKQADPSQRPCVEAKDLGSRVMNKPVTCTSARSRQCLSEAATAFFCTVLQADIDMDPMSSCESSKQGPLQSRHVDKGVCFNSKHRVTSLTSGTFERKTWSRKELLWYHRGDGGHSSHSALVLKWRFVKAVADRDGFEVGGLI